ncbi:MAG TPA: alpha/beta hydrolase [Rhizomicrobium sp.]|nr:alpha/beta hydrolase [Rhizomicrobium sp.]
MNINVTRNVEYGASTRPLHWDIYSPAAPAKGRPGVLVIHGGGYRSGDRADLTDVCVEYARRGYLAIATEYRYLTETTWPGPLEDVKLATRTMRAKAAELDFTPEHLFLTGFSCGAQMALLTANAQSADIAGVAAFYPPALFTKAHGEFLGIADEAAVTAADPVKNVATLPPTILFGGEADPLTPPAMLLAICRAINEAGGTADIHLFSRMIHAFVGLPGMTEQTIGDATRFFNRTVLDKACFDAANAAHYTWLEELTGKKLTTSPVHKVALSASPG